VAHKCLMELDEVSPAYAVTIHKSQGSEFPAVVIPVAMQHYMMLQRGRGTGFRRLHHV
jgi:ATP-dependent exoDNAse (exonuclease V) alpha subunit